MSATAARRATYEDVLNAPPDQIAQVIFGVLHTMPRPAFPHAQVSAAIGTFVVGPFRFGIGGPGGWLILHEPELHLGPEPDILVPDFAGWRLDRGKVPDLHAAWTTLAPDWMCEILSPSTHKIDRGDKMEIYLREQVGHVWLIDPIEHSLEVYRHGGNIWGRASIHHGQARVRAEPFDAIEIDLTPFWVP